MNNTETLKDLQSQWEALLTCEESGVLSSDEICDIFGDKLYDIGLDWESFNEAIDNL